MSADSVKTMYARVDGMYCVHCEQTVSHALRALDGVEQVSFQQNVACIRGASLPAADVIADAIRKAGYETDERHIGTSRRKAAGMIRWYEAIGIAAAILLLAFALNRIFGYNIFNAIPTVDSSVTYGMLFVTGLLTGVHCIGMCGAIGLFASSDARTVRSLKRPLLYNAGRVVSYTAIGALVGLVGSVFSISAHLRGAIILVAAVCMLLMALSMLGLLRFHLPSVFHFKLRGSRGGAFVIGILNGLMPCGPLQAMQLYALSTGSAVRGALSMFLFALGTVPLMLASGALLNLTKGKARMIVGKVASVLILLLSLSMLNRGLLALGVDVSSVFSHRYDGYLAAEQTDGMQTVTFDLDFDAYADVVVQKGVPVRMTIRADEGKITGCNNEVVSVDFGFDVPLSAGDNVIEFTPAETGEFTYTCWMNMIRNHILVIDDPTFFQKGENP